MVIKHLRKMEPRQGWLFEQIVKRIAAENDVPLATAGGNEVLEEIEFAVGALLLRGTRMMVDLSPEIDAMVEVWRKLEREARSKRMAAWWRPEPVSVLAAV